MTTPKFCDDNCKSGWEADRAAGVIYPQTVVDDVFAKTQPDSVMVWPSGTVTMSWIKASGELRFCAYCGADLREENSNGPPG